MKQYIVDAFTEQLFSGNPAAVCVLKEWISDEWMLQIARENNLSETAFVVEGKGEEWELRWFAPGGEIDLCGHGTLATAFVIFSFYEPKKSDLSFSTKSGVLVVEKKEELLEMSFPAYELEEISVTSKMKEALGCEVKEAFLGRDLLLVLDGEEEVRNLKPNQEKIKELEGLILHITAKGKEYDCVSRSFGPKLGIEEDPVCGSGHCHILPYWAKKEGKSSFYCYQASKRGGEINGRVEGKKVYLAGKAVLFAEANIYLEEEKEKDSKDGQGSVLKEGHPLAEYWKESQRVTGLVKGMREQENLPYYPNAWLEIYEGLRKYKAHLKRKQYRLYPAFEEQDIEPTIREIWMFDDEVRKGINQGYHLLLSGKQEEFLELQRGLIPRIEELLRKEEEVLYPEVLRLLERKLWMGEKEGESMLKPTGLRKTGLRKDMKLFELLERYPEAKEYLMELSPKYKKLNNPIAALVMSKVTDLETIAGRGGYTAKELILLLEKKFKEQEKIN